MSEVTEIQGITQCINYDGEFVATLNTNNIIEVVWDECLSEIKKKHLEDLKAAIKELGKTEKMLIYVSTLDFLNISVEAGRYAASEESQKYTLANAVLIDNMAKKLVFNFFVRLNKPKTPVKAFLKKEQAIDWLLGFRKDL